MLSSSPTPMSRLRSRSLRQRAAYLEARVAEQTLELRRTAKPGYVGLGIARVLEVRDRAILLDEKYAPPLL